MTKRLRKTSLIALFTRVFAETRGTVIKITNPGSGKTIYVKVLDKIPDTKLYTNSIIGISNSAREALGVTDSKAWVEISYPVN